MPPKHIKSSSRVTKSTAATASKRKNPSRKSTSFPALAKSISASNTSLEGASMPANKSKVNPAAAGNLQGREGEGDGGPVYFWRPYERNGFLGQWYESEFTVEGDTYATAEMWMMVQKARLFGDEDIAKLMLNTTDPKAHKALGRKVKKFDDKIWNANRRRIVFEGNYHKFTSSKNAEDLKTMLMATRDQELVEASPMDRIWGVGFGEKNAEKNRYRWGLNLLGKVVMDVRARLREEDASEGGIKM